MQERPGLRSWVLREDGSHVAVDVQGLGSFEAWEVLKLFFVMFRDEDLLVVSPITFEACFENFQQLAKNLFESCHLCQAAEDCCHAKHFHSCEECPGFGMTDTGRLGSWREFAVAGSRLLSLGCIVSCFVPVGSVILGLFLVPRLFSPTHIWPTTK